MADTATPQPGGDIGETPQQAAQPPVFDFRKPGGAVAAPPAYELAKPVFFIGFMGAGKTSVARKLARMAGVASIDLDTYIERHCDCKISQIFEESGEAGFRAIETELLRHLAGGEPRLISCGGGAVLSQENRRIMAQHGCVVYLQVTAAEAASRISDTSTRPLFGDLAQAQRVIEERLPYYEDAADIVMDTAGRGTAPLARDLLHILKKEGILWQRR